MITDVILELSLDIFKKFDIFPMPPGAYQDTPERKARYQKIGLLLVLGYGSRTIAAATGVSKTTIKKIRDHMSEHSKLGALDCACGKKRGHLEWCSWRYQKSLSRQQVMNRLKPRPQQLSESAL
jgi:hypothetical protein